MPSPRTLIAVALPWLGSLVAVFWFGQKSAPEVTVEREVVVEKRLPQGPPVESVRAAVPAGPEETVFARADAFEVVAEAQEHLRAGVLSQRGVLKAFESMGRLDSSTVLKAVAEVEAMDPGQPNHGLLMLAVLGRWAEFDGASAMRYAEEALEGDLRSGVIANVVSSWSESDPEAALSWYRARRDDGELRAVLGSGGAALLAPVFQGLASSNAEAALSELIRLGDSNEFGQALEGMVSAMAAAGRSEQLLGHIARLPEGRRGPARQSLVAKWAQIAPSDAARWVGALSASAEREAMASAVALAWVRRDAPAAMAWMFANTPEASQAKQLAESISVWARSDPNAAATGLGSEAPSGVDTDPAVAALSRQIVHRDAVSALAWAGTVRNPAMREQAEASVLSQWAIREPDAAREYLEGGHLSEAHAERLGALLDRGS